MGSGSDGAGLTAARHTPSTKRIVGVYLPRYRQPARVGGQALLDILLLGTGEPAEQEVGE
jgi:hypothetical protein